MITPFETIALVCGSLAALVLRLFADRHRSEEGKSAIAVPFYWRPRSHFTAVGWRYRTVSVACGVGTFLPVCAAYLARLPA